MPTTIAWETRRGIFDLGAILSTVKRVALSPGATFEGMEPTGDMVPALVYNAILGLVAGLGSGLINIAFQMGGQFFKVDRFEHLVEGLVTTLAGGFFRLVAGALIGLVVGVLALLLFAALIHGLLSLLGAVQRPFAETVRALAYVQGSLACLSIVPILGWLLLIFLNPVYQIIAISRVQRASTTHAAIAVLTPWLCILGLVVAVAAAVVVVFGVALASIFN